MNTTTTSSSNTTTKNNQSNDNIELWERCSELFERAVNGNKEALKELEDISNNNQRDFVCLGYVFLYYNKVPDAFDNDKENTLKQRFASILATSNVALHSSNLDNKHKKLIMGFLLKENAKDERIVQKSFVLFKLAAEQNFSLAENEVGECYEKGIGIDPHKELAVHYYKRAAEKGYSVAQHHLGFLYLKQGQRSGAINLLEQSASQGFAGAMLMMGSCYQVGNGVNQDLSLAMQWFKRAADHGNVTAGSLLGWQYLGEMGGEKNEEEGVKWLKKAVDQNDSHACYSLGSLYSKSEDPMKQQEGKELIRRAAEEGDPQAQFEVGLNYFLGERVAMNEEKAIKWFKRSAESGGNKLFEIAKLCRYGNLMQQDKEEFLNLARQLNHLMISTPRNRSSKTVYSIMLDEMELVKKFDQLPVPRWISPQEAYLIIARCYEFGLGVEKDPAKAHQWYHNLSVLNSSAGGYELGRCYEEGIGVEVDLDEARGHYEGVAERGNEDAIARLREYEEDRVRVRFGRKRMI